jgi:hypothetical protein
MGHATVVSSWISVIRAVIIFLKTEIYLRDVEPGVQTVTALGFQFARSIDHTCPLPAAQSTADLTEALVR